MRCTRCTPCPDLFTGYKGIRKPCFTRFWKQIVVNPSTAASVHTKQTCISQGAEKRKRTELPTKGGHSFENTAGDGPCGLSSTRQQCIPLYLELLDFEGQGKVSGTCCCHTQVLRCCDGVLHLIICRIFVLQSCLMSIPIIFMLYRQPSHSSGVSIAHRLAQAYG